jgi:hypothetical protein
VEIKIGDTVQYFKRECVVIEKDKTHVVVQFPNGEKLTTPINTFDALR